MSPFISLYSIKKREGSREQVSFQRKVLEVKERRRVEGFAPKRVSPRGQFPKRESLMMKESERSDPH